MLRDGLLCYGCLTGVFGLLFVHRVSTYPACTTATNVMGVIMYHQHHQPQQVSNLVPHVLLSADLQHLRVLGCRVGLRHVSAVSVTETT